MTTPVFRKAERKSAFLKIALTGPSGSGKSLSGLMIAQGIGGKIAAIDTENGSLSLYADRGEFDVVELRPPFTPEKYGRAIRLAEEAGYNVLLIDSYSHVWAGQGGVMEMKDDLDARGGNRFANWKGPKSEHQRLKDVLLQAQIHVVVTMRSKQAYMQSEDGNGKGKVTKVGMDPIAEPGLEYEFTTVLDLDMSHKAIASKDRTGLFNKAPFIPTPETGKAFMEWLGKAPERVPTPKSEDGLLGGGEGGAHVIAGGALKGKKIAEVCATDTGLAKLKKYVADLEEMCTKDSRPLYTWATYLKVNLGRYINDLEAANAASIPLGEPLEPPFEDSAYDAAKASS